MSLLAQYGFVESSHDPKVWNLSLNFRSDGTTDSLKPSRNSVHNLEFLTQIKTLHIEVISPTSSAAQLAKEHKDWFKELAHFSAIEHLEVKLPQKGAFFPVVPWISSVTHLTLVQEQSAAGRSEVDLEYFGSCEYLEFENVRLTPAQILRVEANLHLNTFQFSDEGDRALPRLLTLSCDNIVFATQTVNQSFSIGKVVTLQLIDAEDIDFGQFNLETLTSLTLAQCRNVWLPEPELVPNLRNLEIVTSGVSNLPEYSSLERVSINVREIEDNSLDYYWNRGIEIVDLSQGTGHVIRKNITSELRFPDLDKPISPEEKHFQQRLIAEVCSNTEDPVLLEELDSDKPIVTVLMSNSSQTGSVAWCFAAQPLFEWWFKQQADSDFVTLPVANVSIDKQSLANEAMQLSRVFCLVKTDRKSSGRPVYSLKAVSPASLNSLSRDKMPTCE